MHIQTAQKIYRDETSSTVRFSRPFTTTARGTCEQVWCMFSLYIWEGYDAHFDSVCIVTPVKISGSCLQSTRSTTQYQANPPVQSRWRIPRKCDFLGCKIAIFSQSTRTQYQAPHLASPGMRNPKNSTICDSIKTAHQVFQLSRGNLGGNFLQIWWKLDVNIAKGFYLEPFHLDQLFQPIDNIEEACRVTPVRVS